MIAFNNYGELKEGVADWLKRDDLTNRIPEFIGLAENRISKMVRVRELESTTQIATASGTAAYSLPTNYVEFRRIYYDNSTTKTRLEFRSPAHYWSIYGNAATGTPKVFTIEGDQVLLGPRPNDTQNIDLLYYARPTVFSNDSDTNDLLTTASGLYLYGALLESAPFLGNDARVVIWTQMFEDMVAKANDADTTDRFSGDPGVGQTAMQNDPRAM